MKSLLAIPAVFLLSLFLASPSCSQDIPLLQFTNVNIATPAQQPATQKITDEELARLYLIRKDFKEAEDIFHRLAAENPRNPLYWNELGIAFHNESELDRALKCYEKAWKVDPHYADAINNAGTIYYERKKFAKAIRVYKRAIAIRGDSAPFYLNLGYAYFNQKDFENSITAFRHALAIDPTSFDPSHSHAGTIIQDRSVHEERGRFYYLLAKSFAESGDIDHAIIYLRKSRDEGYEQFNAVKTDPSFKLVLKDPAAQEFLAPKNVDPAQP
jgi:tetratricopeptide (TPR) repeat protein